MWNQMTHNLEAHPFINEHCLYCWTQQKVSQACSSLNLIVLWMCPPVFVTHMLTSSFLTSMQCWSLLNCRVMDILHLWGTLAFELTHDLYPGPLQTSFFCNIKLFAFLLTSPSLNFLQPQAIFYAFISSETLSTPYSICRSILKLLV